MLGPTKYYLFVFSASIILASTLHSARAGETEDLSAINKKGEKSGKPAQSAMNVEVVDNNGNVMYTDVVTSEDPHLNYNLESLPVGDYTVTVKQGEQVINKTELSNISANSSVITVEVLNEAGEVVFKSSNSDHKFNLENHPNGTYKVNVYQGDNLINTNVLKQ